MILISLVIILYIAFIIALIVNANYKKQIRRNDTYIDEKFNKWDTEIENIEKNLNDRIDDMEELIKIYRMELKEKPQEPEESLQAKILSEWLGGAKGGES